MTMSFEILFQDKEIENHDDIIVLQNPSNQNPSTTGQQSIYQRIFANTAPPG